MDKVEQLDSGIYYLLNKLNSKVYIGSSINLDKRLFNHLWHLRKNEHSNRHLQNAWNKYGEENFKFGIIERIPENKLVEVEQYWIDYYWNRSYNIASKAGNTLGITFSMSEEAKEKISKAMKGEKNPFYGKKHTKETLAKMSKIHKGKIPWNKGKPHSKETLKKISKAIAGRTLTEEWKRKIGEAGKGRKLSDETKKKLSESRKGYKHTEEAKQKISMKNKGRKHTEEWKKNHSEKMKERHRKKKLGLI